MPTKDEVANDLAKRHYQVELGLTSVFRLFADANAELRPEEPIKLLEVNENTIASGILPLSFGPATAYGNYPSVILEVTPEEFDKIKTNELKLPHGWKIGDMIPKPQMVPADGDC